MSSGPSSARIVRGDPLGVVYRYADGREEAHPMVPEEMPVLDRLRRAGVLTYEDDNVRAHLMTMLFPARRPR